MNSREPFSQYTSNVIKQNAFWDAKISSFSEEIVPLNNNRFSKILPLSLAW